MANLPENTENPILRPVTQLEITTKVYGGEYIPADGDQRGVSNLQAIELAERDQYILSRVGEAAVPASGGVSGEVGIADLDSTGKLPKAKNTANVVYTGDTQTITNKTISFADNTLTGVASTDTAQTITNKTISFADNTLTGVASTDTAQTITNKTISFADNTLTGVVGETAAQTITNKTMDRAANTFTCTPTFAEDEANITVTKEMTLVFGEDATQVSYSIGDAPYVNYELRIIVQSSAAGIQVSFKSAPDNYTVVTKSLSEGVHHLTWQGTGGWTFYELSGEYTDNTTFTYLL